MRDRRLSSRTDNLYTSMTHTVGDGLESRDMRASLGAPVFRGNGYGFAIFTRYTATWIEGSRYLPDGLTLHRFDLNLGGGGRIAPGWSLRGGMSVSFSSDLHDLGTSAEALSFSGALLVRHTISSNSSWTLGLAYTQPASVLPVIPIVGFVYQRADSPFRFDAQLPHRLRVSYRVAPRVDTTIGLETRGDSWQVSGRQRALEVERDGGAVYGEVSITAHGPLRLELRLGAAFEQYTLPDLMADTTSDLSLRASAYGQLQVVLVPQ